MVSRYEFLAQLHELLQPQFYMEVGVQFGTSLRLANCPAWGVDPVPMVTGADVKPGHFVFTNTSDAFFAEVAAKPHEWSTHPPLGLAFIDGMHLWEYAIRDFYNIERLYAEPETVVVFDDVLPYNEYIAQREQPPGDWTGDVWKVIAFLAVIRPDLETMLVDTWPTGSLVVWNLAGAEGPERWIYPRYLKDGSALTFEAFVQMFHDAQPDPEVPDWILRRRYPDVITPEEALERLRNR